jgi:hypothetical protein
MDVASDTLSRSAPCNLQVVGRLEIHPEFRTVSKEPRETQGGVGGDTAPSVDNLAYTVNRNAEIARQPVDAYFQRPHQVFPKDLSRVYRRHEIAFFRHDYLSVVVDDFHFVSASFPPDEADSELIVDSYTVLAFPISL